VAAAPSAAAALRGAGKAMISEADNRRIVAAIRAAEAKTSGEIYCVTGATFLRARWQFRNGRMAHIRRMVPRNLALWRLMKLIAIMAKDKKPKG
jgi:uncharacterized membrane protein